MFDKTKPENGSNIFSSDVRENFRALQDDGLDYGSLIHKNYIKTISANNTWYVRLGGDTTDGNDLDLTEECYLFEFDDIYFNAEGHFRLQFLLQDGTMISGAYYTAMLYGWTINHVSPYYAWIDISYENYNYGRLTGTPKYYRYFGIQGQLIIGNLHSDGNFPYFQARHHCMPSSTYYDQIQTLYCYGEYQNTTRPDIHGIILYTTSTSYNWAGGEIRVYKLTTG